MGCFERAAVEAYFLAGNRFELFVADVVPPDDPEDGDPEHYRLRAILRAAKILKRGCPQAEIYAPQFAW
jgi:hypothetical protein